MLKKITTKNKHTFFGYYNKSPWNKSQDKILFCESGFIDHQPLKDDKIKVGYLDIASNTKVYLEETNSWNWQQGCMLQWHPAKDDVIIFNKRIKNKFVSIFLDIRTKEEKIIPFPIYDISKNGKFAVTANFSRLNNLRRGYGYEGIEDPFNNQKIPNEDGIFIVDLKTKKRKLLLSIEQLSKYKPLDSMGFGFHWINHIEFSPDSKKVIFFHRWEVPNKMHYTRLFLLHLENEFLELMPDSGFYSHMCWKDNEEIFGWSMLPGKIGNIRKSNSKSKLIFKFVLPIYRKIIPKKIRKNALPVGYFFFNINKKSQKKSSANNEDGHPSFSPDRKFILTDTYPDRNHYRKLIIYDTRLKKKYLIGEFYSLPEKKYTKDSKWDSSGMRCDLHPRWNRDGTQVCIDSVHEGQRAMYIIDVSKITKN